MANRLGLPIAIIGIAIALFGFIDALATAPGLPELQTLRYILTTLGLILMAIGVLVSRLEDPLPSRVQGDREVGRSSGHSTERES